MSSVRPAHRALVASVSALVVAALAVAACRGALGVDDYTDVAEHFCGCLDELNSSDGGFDPVFASPTDCKGTVTSRLEGAASDDQRAQWLSNYVNTCADDCGKIKDCYYAVPVCSQGGCARDVECCSYDGGVGACQGGYCEQPIQQ